MKMNVVSTSVFLLCFARAFGTQVCTVSQYGCFTDAADARTLSITAALTSTSNSFENCASRCSSFGAKYAGVEIGTQCFCGDKLAASAQARPASECSGVPCPGNSKEKCGAVNRIGKNHPFFLLSLFALN